MKSPDVNNDKRITLPEFISYLTKSKELLLILAHYGILSKDDLRENFGYNEDERQLPDCDSDLENEINENRWKVNHEKIKGKIENPEMKPWMKVGKVMAPKDYPEKWEDRDVPDASLELDYVYGYRCEDTRNNVRYTRNGKIVYHTAAMGIVQDIMEAKQKHFLEHINTISCLAIHPGLVYVATGELGSDPLICVWDSLTMECLVRISGTLKKGICHLAFSNDGKYLAASAADDFHSIAIYSWEMYRNVVKELKGKSLDNIGLIAAGQVSCANVLSLAFNPSNNIIAVPGIRDLSFVDFDNGCFKVKKPMSWGASLPQTLLCGAYLGNSFITGNFNGELFVWKDNTMVNVVTAHKGPVNAIWARDNRKGLITGGNDGIIILWDISLKKELTINIAENKTLNCHIPKIRSVCESLDGNIVMGIRSGEILEYKQGKFNILRSHFKNKLCGLAIHPKLPEFATFGQDGIFANWDIPSRKQKQFAKIDCGGDAVEFSPDGTYLALGCINGQVIILGTEKFATIASRKDRSSAISIIKFAPDCSTMCVGADDGMIFVYSVSTKFKAFKRLKGRHTRVTHIDYSENSKFIQFNNIDCELLYFDLETGKRLQKDAEFLKIENWASWSCVFGWPVQGIWLSHFTGSEVYTADRTKDRRVLATGDAYGTIKLFRYPCYIEGANYQSFRGHSSGITNVRFADDGNYLISIGGYNKSIFLWKYKKNTESKTQEAVPESDPVIIDEPLIKTRREKREIEFEMIETQEVAKIDELLAGKPYSTEVEHSIPSGYKESKGAGNLPEISLAMRYVYGYRSFDCRNNVKWIKGNLILYHTASIVIVCDPEKNDQKYFLRHDADIVSLAVNSTGTIAATGQVARKKDPEIYIWEVESRNVLVCLKGFHTKAVRHLRFSPNGVYLLSIGDDEDHSLAIYDWVNGRLMASAKIDKDQVTTCEFRSDTEFITCGIKQVKFWLFDKLNLTACKGNMGEGPFETSICASFTFVGKVCVTGTSKGNLLVWNGYNAERRINAHKGQVWVLLAKGNGLISGGQDGILIVWTNEYKQLSSIDLSKITRMNPGIRALDVNNSGAYILGTKAAEIIRIYQKKSTVIIRGHAGGEVWGLCVSPNSEKFATCGGDKTLRVYNVDKVTMILPLHEDGRAIDWASNGKFITLASLFGLIYCFDPEECMKTVSKVQSSFGKDQRIDDIKISPSNTMIAFGPRAGIAKIEIMKVNDKGDGLAKCHLINIGLIGGLTHLDWDVSSNFLVINSNSYELRYVNVIDQTVQSSTSSKDIVWHTWTCTLGFPVQGIFPLLSDGTDIHCACRSNNNTVIVTGDSFGRLRILKYPSVIKHSSAMEYRGHAGWVTRVQFLFNDNYIVSIGGHDNTVIVWSAAISNMEKTALENLETSELGDSKAELESAYDETNTTEVDQQIIELQKEYEKKRLALQECNNCAEETVDQLIELITTKPWVAGVKEPTGFIKPPYNQSLAPKINLTLEHIYGYHSKDTRNNVAYLLDGCIGYHAAATGIILNTELNSQRFFMEHTNDILSIAFHPDKLRIATGELAPKPVIYVWNSATCLYAAKFTGSLERGIKSLAFSPNGEHLAAIDIGKCPSLVLYDICSKTLLAHTKIEPGLILQVVFKTEDELITIGTKHFMCWKVNQCNFSSKRGIFKKCNSILGCVAVDKDFVLTGNAAGEVCQWINNTAESIRKVHESTLDCITIVDGMVITGGKDAKVQVMDKSLNLIMTINISTPGFNSVSGEVRSIALDSTKTNLLIGTFGSEIYEVNVNLTSRNINKITTVMRSHYSPSKKKDNEVCGLFSCPNNQFVTVGDDGTLRLWDVVSRKQQKILRFDIGNKALQSIYDQDFSDSIKAQSVASSPEGKHFAVGFKDGSLAIVDINQWAVTYKDKECKARVSDIKFSPEGTLLAIGSHDALIQIYEFPSMIKKATLKGHSSYISHLDWSMDSKSLRTNSGNHEIFFWDIESGNLVPTGATTYRNEPWATCTCIFGWSVQGIWPPCAKGTDINSCDRSSIDCEPCQLLAVGNNKGKVKIFRYPCVTKAECKEGKGHAAHVVNVKFDIEDKHVFSVGGNDGCVFQWIIK